MDFLDVAAISMIGNKEKELLKNMPFVEREHREAKNAIVTCSVFLGIFVLLLFLEHQYFIDDVRYWNAYMATAPYMRDLVDSGRIDYVDSGWLSWIFTRPFQRIDLNSYGLTSTEQAEAIYYYSDLWWTTTHNFLVAWGLLALIGLMIYMIIRNVKKREYYEGIILYGEQDDSDDDDDEEYDEDDEDEE